MAQVLKEHTLEPLRKTVKRGNSPRPQEGASSARPAPHRPSPLGAGAEHSSVNQRQAQVEACERDSHASLWPLGAGAEHSSVNQRQAQVEACEWDSHASLCAR